MSRGLRYYDSATPPAPWQAQEAFRSGGRVYGGYLGGAQAAVTWGSADFRVVRDAGFAMVGFWVARGAGGSDGRLAGSVARGVGLDPQRLSICIDQEAGWPDPSPFFTSLVRSYGYRCGLYSTLENCKRQVAAYDFVVVASYDSNPDPVSTSQYFTSVKPVIVQNWPTHTEFGLSVDRGIADPSFYYGVSDMQFMDPGAALSSADLTARRVKIHEWYRGFLVREVENDAAMQAHLLTWVRAGGEAVLAEILDSGEGAGVTRAARRVLGL